MCFTAQSLLISAQGMIRFTPRVYLSPAPVIFHISIDTRKSTLQEQQSGTGADHNCSSVQSSCMSADSESNHGRQQPPLRHAHHLPYLYDPLSFALFPFWKAIFLMQQGTLPCSCLREIRSMQARATHPPAPNFWTTFQSELKTMTRW